MSGTHTPGNSKIWRDNIVLTILYQNKTTINTACYKTSICLTQYTCSITHINQINQLPRISCSCCSCCCYCPSQKASHGNISGTKRGIIDPHKWSKCSYMVKMFIYGQNVPKWSKWTKMVKNGQKSQISSILQQQQKGQNCQKW